jgi:hypothetical protein
MSGNTDKKYHPIHPWKDWTQASTTFPVSWKLIFFLFFYCPDKGAAKQREVTIVEKWRETEFYPGMAGRLKGQCHEMEFFLKA